MCCRWGCWPLTALVSVSLLPLLLGRSCARDWWVGVHSGIGTRFEFGHSVGRSSLGRAAPIVPERGFILGERDAE